MFEEDAVARRREEVPMGKFLLVQDLEVISMVTFLCVQYFIIWSRCYSVAQQYMSHVTKKTVFGVSDQLRLKPACSATEAS